MNEPPAPVARAARRIGSAVPSPGPSRAVAFREILADLSRLERVRGGLIVTPDGLVITSALPSESPVEALAALGAALGRELELGADRLGRGEFKSAVFSADDGTVFVGGHSVGFLVLIGDRDVDVASVRTTLGRALDHLRG
jgi:predicted regulator of Ras-like GTPase activity (Roadblock/LC7/MglB family)